MALQILGYSPGSKQKLPSSMMALIISSMRCADIHRRTEGAEPKRCRVSRVRQGLDHLFSAGADHGEQHPQVVVLPEPRRPAEHLQTKIEIKVYFIPPLYDLPACPLFGCALGGALAAQSKRWRAGG